MKCCLLGNWHLALLSNHTLITTLFGMCDFNCMFFLSMLILTANYFGLFIYQPLLTLFELKKGVMMTPKRLLFFSALFQIVFQLNITSRFQGRCIVKRAVVLHTNFGRLCLLLFFILARFWSALTHESAITEQAAKPVFESFFDSRSHFTPCKTLWIH